MTTAFFGSLTTSLLKSYSALLLHSHSFISVLIENRRVRQCKYMNRWTYQCRGLKPNKSFTKSFVCVWGWMALCVYVIIPSSDSLVRLTEEIPSITDAHHCTQTLIKKHSCTYITDHTHTFKAQTDSAFMDPQPHIHIHTAHICKFAIILLC